MDVDAIFQCHKNPLSTYECLQSFRKFYPDSKVVLLSDNGYDYTEMAKRFNSTYIHEHVGLRLSAPPASYLPVVERWLKMLNYITSEYYIYLEDDVLVTSRYTEDFKGDVNGNCINFLNAHTFDRIPFSVVRGKTMHYTGHGGSVFKTDTIRRVLENKEQIQWLLSNWEAIGMGPTTDIDTFLSLLVLINGGTMHHLTQHKDLMTNNIQSLDGIAALHQFKQSYAKSLPNNLKDLVNEEIGSSNR